LANLWQPGWQPVALLNEFGESGALVVFAVGQYHSRLARRDHIEPTHEIALPRVCAESTQGVNRRFHSDFLSENLHLFLAINQPSPERPLPLIAYDQHVRAWLPKVRR